MMSLVLLGQRILKQTNDDAILLILEFYEFLLMLVGWLVGAGWGLLTEARWGWQQNSICMVCMVCMLAAESHLYGMYGMYGMHKGDLKGSGGHELWPTILSLNYKLTCPL